LLNFESANERGYVGGVVLNLLAWVNISAKVNFFGGRKNYLPQKIKENTNFVNNNSSIIKENFRCFSNKEN